MKRNPLERVSERIGEQIVDEPVPQNLKEIVELASLTSTTADFRAIVDVPDPQIKERLRQRTVEQMSTSTYHRSRKELCQLPGGARLGEYHRTDCRFDSASHLKEIVVLMRLTSLVRNVERSWMCLIHGSSGSAAHHGADFTISVHRSCKKF